MIPRFTVFLPSTNVLSPNASCTASYIISEAYATCSLANACDAHRGLARYPHLAARLFNAKIDDVLIYNRALSATEVKQLYSAADDFALAEGLLLTPRQRHLAVQRASPRGKRQPGGTRLVIFKNYVAPRSDDIRK